MDNEKHVTRLWKIEDYRIIPVRFMTAPNVFNPGYSVQYNVGYKIFGWDLGFDRWITKDTYILLIDAVGHIEHTTGSKYGI